jgi:N-acetylated-alpha-linked acidic dipeptidase
MSYEDAIALLKSLKGKGVKAGDVSKDWVGGLGYYDVEYWTGPSEVDVRLMNEVNTRVMPIWSEPPNLFPSNVQAELIAV